MPSIPKKNQPIDANPEAAHELAVSVAKFERVWLYAAIILLAGLFVAAPAFHGTWLWDDDQEITANPALVAMKTAGDSLYAIWHGDVGADYLPVKSTVLWLEYQIWGVDNTGYHLATTFFHLINSLLIWVLFRKLGLRCAWLGGLIFAIHPILVESVAWVSEQKNTLSLALLLPSMIFYLRFDERLKAGRGEAAMWNYLAALIFFVLSLLSKSSGVMMPFTILLFAWWKYANMSWRDLLCFATLGCVLSFFGGIAIYIWKEDFNTMVMMMAAVIPGILLGWAWWQLKEKHWRDTLNAVYAALPFFLITIVICLVTVHFQFDKAIGAEGIPVPKSPTLNAGVLIFFYTWKTIFPFDLCPIYPKWEFDPMDDMYLFALWPVLLGILYWFWLKRNTWGKHVLFGYGFFLIYLVPVLGFVTMSYMRITWAADHFLYISAIGIIALFVALIDKLYSAVPLHYKKAALTTIIAILAVTTGYAHFYSGIFLNEAAMWTFTLSKNENAWQAHSRYGKVLLDSGNIDAAFYHIYHSNRLRPDLAETNNNMGVLLMQKGRPLEAIPYMQKAATIMPDAIPFRVNLANLLANTGHPREALPHYEYVLGRDGNNPILHTNYGFALYQDGQRDRAIAEFRTALNIDPNQANAKKFLELALNNQPLVPPQQQQQAAPQAQQSLLPPPPVPGTAGKKRR
jgi:Tfp pilus assembly protein PilF